MFPSRSLGTSSLDTFETACSCVGTKTAVFNIEHFCMKFQKGVPTQEQVVSKDFGIFWKYSCFLMFGHFSKLIFSKFIVYVFFIEFWHFF